MDKIELLLEKMIIKKNEQDYYAHNYGIYDFEKVLGFKTREEYEMFIKKNYEEGLIEIQFHGKIGDFSRANMHVSKLGAQRALDLSASKIGFKYEG